MIFLEGRFHLPLPMLSVSAIITNVCRRSGSENDTQVSRIPSTLSVAAVDVVVACQPSPSHSILTLTPGRTRNIDQDMEALRLSRQDNPFLQVPIDTTSVFRCQTLELCIRSPEELDVSFFFKLCPTIDDLYYLRIIIIWDQCQLEPYSNR